MRDRVALVLTAAAAALHLAVANRYDLFRDELYFIVCGQHPSWGYADQPPLVPLLAAGGYALGEQTWIVRLPAVFAAAALVFVCVKFARLLGGGDAAAWIAGTAAAFGPSFLGITATLNTTTFEPLAWTLIAYLITCAIVNDDRRALLWAGVAAGVAMQAKYALPLWLLALALGLAIFGPRAIFARRELWLGLVAAVAIAIPSIVWQAFAGFPFVELVRNAHLKDVAVGPLAFALNQVLDQNPLAAPIWMIGLIAPFTSRAFRQVRFLPAAFAVVAIATIAGHGKDYYLAPGYPTLLAIGSVALVRLVRVKAVAGAYAALVAALALAVSPIPLPILSPAALIAYQDRIGIHPSAQERLDVGAALPPLFADMLGWHDFTREVGTAYDALPRDERDRTSILVDNYGEAAALDLYGGPYHLPPALSGHNQYYLWGLRGQQPVDILRVQDDPEALRPYCASVTLLGKTYSRYARGLENGKTIAFCRGVHPALQTVWPQLKDYI